MTTFVNSSWNTKKMASGIESLCRKKFDLLCLPANISVSIGWTYGKPVLQKILNGLSFWINENFVEYKTLFLKGIFFHVQFARKNWKKGWVSHTRNLFKFKKHNIKCGFQWNFKLKFYSDFSFLMWVQLTNILNHEPHNL